MKAGAREQRLERRRPVFEERRRKAVEDYRAGQQGQHDRYEAIKDEKRARTLIASIPQDEWTRLQEGRWRGNVRQLRNVVERVALLHDGEVVGRDALELTGVGAVERGNPPSVRPPAPQTFEPRPLEDVVRVASEAAERAHIEAMLRHTEGNKSRAAELLGISRSTLWKKMKRFDGEAG